jgi:hypothetical protein
MKSARMGKMIGYCDHDTLSWFTQGKTYMHTYTSNSQWFPCFNAWLEFHKNNWKTLTPRQENNKKTRKNWRLFAHTYAPLLNS